MFAAPSGGGSGVGIARARAVFLDRDNTIIHNEGDLGDPALVRLVRGAAHAIGSLQHLGFHIIVVTNQGGVARGAFTEDDVQKVHQRIADLIHEVSGAAIDRFYYCPYHPDGTIPEYTREHPWRKPQPGMLLQAAADLHLDLEQSWMVGDQPRDIVAGQAAGVQTILLDPTGAHAGGDVRPDYRVTTIAEAAAMIAQNRMTRTVSRRAIVVPTAPSVAAQASPAPVAIATTPGNSAGEGTAKNDRSTAGPESSGGATAEPVVTPMPSAASEAAPDDRPSRVAESGPAKSGGGGAASGGRGTAGGSRSRRGGGRHATAAAAAAPTSAAATDSVHATTGVASAPAALAPTTRPATAGAEDGHADDSALLPANASRGDADASTSTASTPATTPVLALTDTPAPTASEMQAAPRDQRRGHHTRPEPDDGEVDTGAHLPGLTADSPDGAAADAPSRGGAAAESDDDEAHEHDPAAAAQDDHRYRHHHPAPQIRFPAEFPGDPPMVTAPAPGSDAARSVATRPTQVRRGPAGVARARRRPEPVVALDDHDGTLLEEPTSAPAQTEYDDEIPQPRPRLPHLGTQQVHHDEASQLTAHAIREVLTEIRSWRQSQREFTSARLLIVLLLFTILIAAAGAAVYLDAAQALSWIGVLIIAQLTVVGLLVNSSRS